MMFLIVDDEPLARQDLARSLAKLLPALQLLEAGSVQDARQILLSRSVDGVFLDLEMPGSHGTSLLPELRLSRTPAVLITAHDEFAVDAYDQDVVDYLLKPVEPSRLARAITRLRARAKPEPQDDFVILGDQQNCWPVRRQDIVMVEADGNYVTLHFKGRKPLLLSRSLKEVQTLLGNRNFVRANRSQLVGLAYLKSIQKQLGGGMTAELDGVGRIEFSRRQALAFRNHFEV